MKLTKRTMLSFHSLSLTTKDFKLQRARDFPSHVRVGPHTTHLMIEALKCLRQSLKERGGTLLIRRGDPLEILPALAHELKANQVVWNELPGYDEEMLSNDMKTALSSVCAVKTFHSYTLFHPEDLPKDTEEWNTLARPKEKRSKRKKKSKLDETSHRWYGMPVIMGDFRRAARAAANIRPCVDQALATTSFANVSVDLGEIPTLKDCLEFFRDQSFLSLPNELILSVTEAASRRKHNSNQFGERSGMRHLHEFLSSGGFERADRSKADVSDKNSSRLSDFLAWGCLSPRQIYHAANKAGCDWLCSHLEMRDFFQYTIMRLGKDAFRLEGSPVHNQGKKGAFSEMKVVWNDPSSDKQVQETWHRWASGNTGLPLVDAGMREMIQTGYVSNRVRQNMASVLTKDLKIDWRFGAAWMHFCLGDACVAANYGNWCYFGGVGSDPKNRHFRTVSQALRYDSGGSYVKKWLPSLRALSQEAVFRPWDFSDEWAFTTIIDPSTQYTWQDKQRLETKGTLL